MFIYKYLKLIFEGLGLIYIKKVVFTTPPNTPPIWGGPKTPVGKSAQICTKFVLVFLYLVSHRT